MLISETVRIRRDVLGSHGIDKKAIFNHSLTKETKRFRGLVSCRLSDIGRVKRTQADLD